MQLVECICWFSKKRTLSKVLPYGYKEAVLKQIPSLVYPFNNHQENQRYIFVLTSHSESKTDTAPKRKYGFVVYNSDDTTICLISEFFHWTPVFFSLLQVLLRKNYNLFNTSSVSNSVFLTSSIGTSIFNEINTEALSKVEQVQIPLSDTENLPVIKPDERFMPSNENYFYLQNLLALSKQKHGIDVILAIFSSILHERVVLLVGENIEFFNSVILAIVELIYPLEWVHMLTPVLSENLLDYIAPPFPALIGVHSGFYEQCSHLVDVGNQVVLKVEKSDSFVVNDPFEDRKSLPQEVVDFIIHKIKNCDATTEELSLVFLNTMAKLLVGYEKCFQMSLDDVYEFDFEQFGKFKRKWVIKPGQHEYFPKLTELQCFK